MSHTPNYNAKLQSTLGALKPGIKTCPITGETWTCAERDLKVTKNLNLPQTDHAPLTRLKWLSAMWPGGQWWYNRHAELNKPIVCPVHPSTGIKVLPDVEWFDKDFSSLGKETDLKSPFFNQLIALRRAVPSQTNRNFEPAENSISIVSLGDVNSYFVVLSKSKDTFFAVSALETESSAEVYNSSSITNCYQVIHCERMHTCSYIRESKDCIRCDFLFDCRNCENCFGATNKRNAKYLWFNKQLSKKEWEARRAEVDLGSRKETQKWLAKFNELVKAAPWPENFNVQSENSTGEYLTKTTNCDHTYFADGGAKNEYWTTFSIGQAENNAYTGTPANSRECYWSADVSSCFRCHYSYLLSRCQNVEYSTECYDCENCFGCVGLRKKQFCILNKQYAESEYWKTLDAIKCAMLERGEYGQFLPAKMSPAWFPESGAFKYHLADRTFGEKINAHLFEPDTDGAMGDIATIAEVTDANELPDCVDELDSWIGKPVYDSTYNRRFSLLAPEVALYKKLRVAPPTKHHVKRLLDTIHTSQVGVFKQTACTQCNKEITVSENPTYSNRKILCKRCYLDYLEKNG